MSVNVRLDCPISARPMTGSFRDLVDYYTGMVDTFRSHSHFWFDFSVDFEQSNTFEAKVIITLFNIELGGFSFNTFYGLAHKFFTKYHEEYVYSSLPAVAKLDLYINVQHKPLSDSVVIKTNCKEENSMYLPEVKEIIHNKSKKKGEVFTVKWSDDTETTVKLMEGDVSDEYVAFMYCMSIKMFGSKGECRQYVQDKKQVFKDRVQRRSEELKQNRVCKNMEQRAKEEVPYAGGLRVPALATSPMFKKNGGGQ